MRNALLSEDLTKLFGPGRSNPTGRVWGTTAFALRRDHLMVEIVAAHSLRKRIKDMCNGRREAHGA